MSKILSCLVLVCCCISLAATELIIHKTNGTQDAYELSEIESITFGDSGAEIPTDGLEIYYPFTGNCHDESGNGHNAVASGPLLTTDRFGNDNCAFWFDGSDDYMECGTDPIDINTDVSFMVWILQEESALYHYVLTSGGQANDGGISLEIYSSEVMVHRVTQSMSYHNLIGDNVMVENGQWTFIACVFDSTDEVFSLYFNGEPVMDFDGEPGSYANNYQDLFIGRINFANNQNFSGKIDDIRIYNRALTAADIQAIYHEGGWEE